MFTLLGFLSAGGLFALAVAAAIYFRSRWILYGAFALWLAFNIFGAGFQQGEQSTAKAVGIEIQRMTDVQTALNAEWAEKIEQRNRDEAAANLLREKYNEEARNDPDANSCGLRIDSVRRLRSR